MLRALIITVVVLTLPTVCAAQFSNATLTTTTFGWVLGGDLVRGDGAPPIEAGDEIGAFFGDRLIGWTQITAAQAASGEYGTLLTYGDNPATSEVEGPTINEIITFQYFDASTNTTITDMRAVNASGEPVNLAWQGAEFFIIPDLPFPPEFFAPSSLEQTLRVGTGDGGDGGGGNGGGETPSGNPDVNGDGRITKEDAALVLRVVVGGARALDAATVARADVDGDGTVDTDDAIAVLRAN